MEEIERTVMTALLGGDDSVLDALRFQYQAAAVTSREFSGLGFFTLFAVPDSCRLVHPADFEISDVYLELEGLEHGAGVVLFARGGRLDFLEGFTYDEPWPDAPRLRELGYLVREPGSRIS